MIMKKKDNKSSEAEDMRMEYDFAGGVRGKYSDRFPKNTIAVVLEPDVAEAYPDSESVNRALRAILQAAPTKRRKAVRRHA
jgi:hypothetical protein